MRGAPATPFSDRFWRVGAYALATLIHVPLVVAVQEFGAAIASARPVDSVITLLDTPDPERIGVVETAGAAARVAIDAASAPGAADARVSAAVDNAARSAGTVTAPTLLDAELRPTAGTATAARSDASTVVASSSVGPTTAAATALAPLTAATAALGEPTAALAPIEAPAVASAVPAAAVGARLADAGVLASAPTVAASTASASAIVAAPPPSARADLAAVPANTSATTRAAPVASADAASAPAGRSTATSAATAAPRPLARIAIDPAGTRLAARSLGAAPVSGTARPRTAVPATAQSTTAVASTAGTAARGAAAIPATAVATVAATPRAPQRTGPAPASARVVQNADAPIASAPRTAAIAPGGAGPGLQSNVGQGRDRAVLADFVRGYEGGGCFAALTVEVAGADVAVAGFSRDEAALATFSDALGKSGTPRPAAATRRISEEQCSALAFAREQPAYPDFPLRLAIAPDRIASGATVRGTLTGTGPEDPVTLLVLDDEGRIQDASFLLERGTKGDWSFETPLSLTGDPVPTVQLFVALAGRGPLAAMRPPVPVEARRYFKEIDRLLKAGNETLDVAIAAFTVDERGNGATP